MIDLHLHLDGSLRPETVRELLLKKGIVNWKNEEEARLALSVGNDCSNLNEYLEKFDYPTKMLQNVENMKRAVYELAQDVYKQNVTYAEIRFAPQLATMEGISQEAAVMAAIAGAEKAMTEHDNLRIGLILCLMRGKNHDANFETVMLAAKYLGKIVCAIDLAGAEALYPTKDFSEEFELAKKLHIPVTIHAGEAAGPESIWKALEFGATRIGHGVRCIEDSTLVDYLVRYKIPLEVCPISNMQTKVFSNMQMYPIKELIFSGVRVTLNTDNMTVSNTNLIKEREFVKQNCGITDEDIELMNKYSQEAAFLLK